MALTLTRAQLYEAFDTDARPVVEFLAWIVVRYGIVTPPAVLDVGCGTGRLFAPLVALGWTVAGLEPDPTFRARAETVAEPLGASVEAGGFTNVDGRETFDLIVGINSSFAHLLTPGARTEALRRCHRALRRGGVLVLDLPNLPRILREYRVPVDRETAIDGRAITLRRTHTIDTQAATFTTHQTYTVREPDGTMWSAEEDHVYSITTWPELEHILLQAGFARIELFGSMADRAPGRADARMVIVAGRG